MLHDMTQLSPKNIEKRKKIENRLENLDSARAFLTVKKKIEKILRFSNIDDFSKKKSKKMDLGMPQTPQKGVNFFRQFFKKKAL